MPHRIALISDTHDLLRPQALAFLRGARHIVHAGDVCGADVLAAVSAIAPTTAVRGNNDRGGWAAALRVRELVELDGVRVCVIHDLAELDVAEAARAGARVIVSGHSHRPRIDERDGLLFVNPGSAGPRRFSLPISAAELWIDTRSNPPSVRAQLVPLDG